MQFARLGGIVVAASLAMGAANASAVEIWTIRDGRASMHFYTDLLQTLGLELTQVNETMSAPAEEVLIEAPHWNFILDPTSQLSFEVEDGLIRGRIDGSLQFDGGFGLRDVASGVVAGAHDFSTRFGTEELDAGITADVLHLEETGSPAAFELRYGKVVYQRAADVLRVHGFDITMSGDLASRLGRPELAGRLIGFGEIYTTIEMTGGVRGSDPAGPNSDRGGFRDVKLGILSGITDVARTGTYPEGMNALSMSTTSCNVGDVDVEWHAPMQEDHPGIVMTLYRELDGRFEQIGVSDVKHGFFALSSSQCTPCQHPSDGSYLGVGCSDTYGSGNNSDRQWLAPRTEWTSFPGTWECTASHFASGMPDCSRRHGSGGHGSIDHRLPVADADLVVPGATFYYGAYYVVRADENKINNEGSRRATASWTGSAWNFSTPSGDNPLLEGPAVVRFGDLQTWKAVPKGEFSNGEGSVLLCAETTDLGNGMTHYEYALYNRDSDRGIRRFSIPLGDVTDATNLGFHDPDSDVANDWTVTIADGFITWETEDHPLTYGLQFNFRFDGNAAAQEGNAELETYVASPVNDAFTVTTWIPEGDVASVGETASSPVLRLSNSPNPLAEGTTIRFELAESVPVTLEIFDTSGRKVRTLVEDTRNAGSHEVVWDTRSADGKQLGSGVYYYRLKAGASTAVNSMHVIR
jgi:hypothetical protein